MAQFRDLKSGYPIYIFDTKEIKVSQGNVSSVSKPYFSANAGLSQDMMVDVTAQVEGETRTYTLKENTDAGFDPSRSQLIATGREIVIRELESMRLTSEQALNQIDHHRRIVDRCTEVLADFDPSEREKREMDDRISRIEQSNTQITKMLTQLLNQRKNDND